MMERWTVRNVKFNTIGFAKALGVSPVVAKLMVNRSIYELNEAKSFLNSTIDNFHDGKSMKDLSKAVALIKESIENNKKILIVGDYDVDGIISTYILNKALSRCNANVSFHIPDRIKEGYGINESIIRKAAEDNIDVIITCDNGISAIDQIKLAKELGLKVIVTDHHDIPFIEKEDGSREYIIPEGNCVVNPKRKDCNYPFKSLCGAGVAFKFIEELYRQFNIPKSEAIELLQYVAIAIVCDVVDLVDENRIMLKKGLELINNTNNIGLRALFKATGLEGKIINVYSLGFVIGPSINASGRLEQAIWALKLLMEENKELAEELAHKLHELNKDRQELTKEGLEKAIEVIEKNNMNKDKVLVVYLEDVHESIAGIIAGRIREKYNLPTIVLTKTHDGAKGSGRSIEEYNMYEELIKCKDILGKFGGHPMAAGMSIPEENIEEFRKRLNELTVLTDEDVIPKVSIDMPLQLSEINYGLIDEIAKLEPYGKGNSKPSFAVKNLTVRGARVLGKDKNVLKLNLTDGNLFIDGIFFGDVDAFEEEVKNSYGEMEYMKLLDGNARGIKMDFVYYPEINEYMGNKKVQIVINNFRIAQ